MVRSNLIEANPTHETLSMLLIGSNASLSYHRPTRSDPTGRSPPIRSSPPEVAPRRVGAHQRALEQRQLRLRRRLHPRRRPEVHPQKPARRARHRRVRRRPLPVARSTQPRVSAGSCSAVRIASHAGRDRPRPRQSPSQRAGAGPPAPPSSVHHGSSTSFATPRLPHNPARAACRHCPSRPAKRRAIAERRTSAVPHANGAFGRGLASRHRGIDRGEPLPRH